MAKAIIRINAFLDRKLTREVYNLIHDQAKDGSEVIIVPAYCDVYVLDDDVKVEFQKKESEGNKCGSCKHLLVEPFDQPCIGCCYNGINISGLDKWEAKDNGI